MSKGLTKRRNTWYFRVKRHGKERWMALGTRDREEARRLVRYAKARWRKQMADENMARLAAEQRQDQKPKPDDAPAPQTVGELLRAWLVCLRRNEKGRHLAQQRAEAYLLPFWAARPLQAVKPHDVREFARQLQAGTAVRVRRDRETREVTTWRLAPQSVVHVLADLRATFNF